jgi:hypothetical protein
MTRSHRLHGVSLPDRSVAAGRQRDLQSDRAANVAARGRCGETKRSSRHSDDLIRQISYQPDQVLKMST